ncbi:protein of unknown function [Candidatus Bipolaricaulis anaerobius]|uniref:Uncharacterized protein n=1 Tax=Candidatus Bipolaricaulis anaerobius TaxID=2026885 RepID=A0A2X3KI03_9BACT|nr:hypothetical protein [Candidatus Bipolaricaulis anaerobius]SQD92211.1 protein of unknown function [Candidatus Bipolaricaulis anaerobius]
MDKGWPTCEPGDECLDLKVTMDALAASPDFLLSATDRSSPALIVE